MVGDFLVSSILLLICILFDMLDGITARWFKAQSHLGKELDSLADLVSFGIAPAYLYYLLSPFEGIMMYIIPCFLVLGSALRLAKFNIIPSSTSFQGLPTPATAFFFIGLYFSYHYENDFVTGLFTNKITYIIMPLFFFLMMLSNLKMFSLKGMDRKIWSNIYLLMQLLIFVSLLFVDYKIAIPVSVLSYILLSFIQNVTVKG